MLLPTITDSLGIAPRAVISAVRLVSPRAPVDILKAFVYERELFGKPFCMFAQAVMRGESVWSEGEREFLGSFVSNLNHCLY